ncbi:hypothetical protein [Verrucosispora sioxanthis]|uniref:hypothetical protein n=1 Tax=Verrucosispora sioxanthis TaxID=2499994 RepID=UPI001C11DA94|nr:hypothetical protein [Verrucosispora sioxanthis]
MQGVRPGLGVRQGRAGRTANPYTARGSQPLIEAAHPRRTATRKANVLAGRLSRGGSGPCYTLVTDDGREYAMHGTDKGTFATGAWVRVTTAPAADGVDCGPGIPVSILKMSPVG